MKLTLKNILVTVWCVAVVLVLITFYVVFYANTGTYVVNSDVSSNTVFSTSTAPTASSTASSTIASSTAIAPASSTTIVSSAASGTYTVNYTNPPIAWSEGNEAMSITGGTLSGSQLTLDLQIVMGSVAECVPLNIRVVTDENGDLAPPIDPQFSFPDTGTCTGTPGETYTDQQIVFNVNPDALPIILNTGGVSNILFEADTTPSGGLTIQLPPSAD